MRQNERRRVRNMSFRSKTKTAVKKFLVAAEGKSEDAATLLSEATSLLHQGVSKGVFHKNTASRTVARLAKKISAS
jgi:small subunit ribosomal protein S20